MILLCEGVGLLGAPHADSACGSGAQPGRHPERSEESLIAWPLMSSSEESARCSREGRGCHSERNEESLLRFRVLCKAHRGGSLTPSRGIYRRALVISFFSPFFSAPTGREAVYATIATISSFVSFSTTGFINCVHTPCRAPDCIS